MKLNVSILPIGIFLIFLVFKLANIGVVADWSWWLVTTPLWLPIILALIVFLFVFLYFVLFDK